MGTSHHTLHSVAARLSGLDRRRTLGVVIAAIGAASVSIGLVSTPATADGSFVCPDQPNPTYDGVLYQYDPPGVEVVEVGNWPALWVGVGVGDGSDHILYGDGVTLMNNDVLPVFADTGMLARDAHLCKLDTTATTVPQTTAPQTTAPQTTAPETTAPETTAPETTTPETTAPETTSPETTAPETTTPETTAPETTTPETETTAPSESVTTTTDAQTGGPTTTIVIDEEFPTTTTTVPELGSAPTTTVVEIAPPTTTITPTSVAAELPRTGTDSARALITFGSLMMLMGGVLVLRSRRGYDFS